MFDYPSSHNYRRKFQELNSSVIHKKITDECFALVRSAWKNTKKNVDNNNNMTSSIESSSRLSEDFPVDKCLR